MRCTFLFDGLISELGNLPVFDCVTTAAGMNKIPVPSAVTAVVVTAVAVVPFCCTKAGLEGMLPSEHDFLNAGGGQFGRVGTVGGDEDEKSSVPGAVDDTEGGAEEMADGFDGIEIGIGCACDCAIEASSNSSESSGIDSYSHTRYCRCEAPNLSMHPFVSGNAPAVESDGVLAKAKLPTPPVDSGNWQEPFAAALRILVIRSPSTKVP